LNEKYNNIPSVVLHHYYNAMRIMILKRKRILIAIAENLILTLILILIILKVILVTVKQ